MSGTNQPSANNGHDDDILKFILFGVVFVTLYFLIHLFAGAATYLYFSFTYLPWLAGVKLGAIGSAAIFLLYAVACYFIDKARAAKLAKKVTVNPERSKGFLILAVYWVVVALITIVSGDPKQSFMLNHIRLICNPANEPLPFASCQGGIDRLMDAGIFNLFSLLIAPNLVLAILIIPEVFKGYMASTKHPELLTREQPSIPYLIHTLRNEYAPLAFYDKINPNKYPMGTGPFARLYQSREFALEENLITGFCERPSTESEIKKMEFKQQASKFSVEEYAKEKNDFIPIVDSERFEDVMLAQLGRPWTDVESLRPEEVVVMAITIAQTCSLEKQMSDKEASKILKDTFEKIDAVWVWLASCLDSCKIKKPTDAELKIWPDGYNLNKLPSLTEYPKYEELKKHLQRWLPHPIMLDILKQHAYTSTIIYAMVLKARGVGVYQPSNFRWIKLYDRSLYALIQNVGRPSVFAEGMGPVSHYYSELKTGEAQLRPDFQAAYSGFCDRLQMFLYTKDDVAQFERGELAFKTSYRDEDFNINGDLYLTDKNTVESKPKQK